LRKFGEQLTKLENASYTGNQAWKKTNVNRIFAFYVKKMLGKWQFSWVIEKTIAISE